MSGGSPVMTESERRAYRYGQAASPKQRALGQLGCIRKTWSNDSLSSYGGGGGGRAGGGAQACVCAPTTHPGSFRCKHHRHASNLGAAAPAGQVADADAKRQEAQQQEVSSAEQEKATWGRATTVLSRKLGRRRER
ncbi:uncharacterized protein LOC102708139 [Oryza brachyantha]|uniref:uncharacterized protein LOC102708139 n=1 Tax=Oryza brachyantha TaxID=4533 RepID=UPI001AD9EF3F|nr:uncharacterized protein LOC102708139 [Oryza brachyantha]